MFNDFFKKYPSIENSYNTKFLNFVYENAPKDMIWDVTEKVHGANFSFLTDGVNVDAAKRTSVIGENERFYDYYSVYEAIVDNIKKAFVYIKENIDSDAKLVQFYGELFGGGYPSDKVERINTALIQKEIYYSPNENFYGFDIRIVNSKDESYFLNPDQMRDVYSKNDILCSLSLFKGTLNECLEYPNEFITTIPRLLGYEDLKDNLCEGVVIKPMVPLFTKNGDRFIIKNKGPRFKEKKSHKSSGDSLMETRISAEFLKVCSIAETYVTENRLNNVISHHGEYSIPREFSELMKDYCNDIITDLVKENSGFSDKEIKMVKKHISHLATNLIKTHYNM